MTVARFPPQLAIGRLIRAIRLRQEHRKQFYWANRIGVSTRQWIRWEAGHSVPSYDSMILLCQAFPDLQVTLMSPHVTYPVHVTP